MPFLIYKCAAVFRYESRYATFRPSRIASLTWPFRRIFSI